MRMIVSKLDAVACHVIGYQRFKAYEGTETNLRRPDAETYLESRIKRSPSSRCMKIIWGSLRCLGTCFALLCMNPCPTHWMLHILQWASYTPLAGCGASMSTGEPCLRRFPPGGTLGANTLWIWSVWQQGTWAKVLAGGASVARVAGGVQCSLWGGRTKAWSKRVRACDRAKETEYTFRLVTEQTEAGTIWRMWGSDIKGQNMDKGGKVCGFKSRLGGLVPHHFDHHSDGLTQQTPSKFWKVDPIFCGCKVLDVFAISEFLNQSCFV